MPIPLPNLDDRHWADLVDEGRALIPLYAPEWTDHNLHDPGITLIELLAWIAEMDIYQLNRIPERHKRKFLALVGISPEPPRPAHTVLSFTLTDGTPPLSLPVGVEFAGNDPSGQETRFRTLEPITVVPGRLQAVQVKDEQGFHNVTDHWLRGESFGVFGAIPQLGAELYLGFSHAWPLSAPVSLFFTFAGSHAGEEARRHLVQEMSDRKSACLPRLSDFLCPPGAPSPPSMTLEPEEVSPHHGVHLVWEVLTTAGAATAWRRLEPHAVDDGTRALTLDGRVRLQLPAEMAKKRLDPVAAELYYLRIRFAMGTYDAPPMLQQVALNGVMAEQAQEVEAVPLGSGDGTPHQELRLGDGTPHQELRLREAPVQASSLQLFSFEGNEWRAWRRRPDFDGSTRRDLDFQLDPTTGAITFGDGEQGRVPPFGTPLYAVYRATRAEAGNLAAGTINQLANSPHNQVALGQVALGAILEQVKAGQVAILNPVAATGGAPAETLAHAIGRAIELMETPQRAVTLQDYERLAMRTPGVQLSRVTARANLHPSFPCFKAPGMITVMILPNLPGPRPVPSPGLRQTVAAYLNRRRIIGTRVEVVGPTYLQVAVRARIRAYTGVNKANLQQKIAMTLDNFLHPLHGGPDKTGWPFGRDVYRTEILQVIDEVPGVDHVLTLELLPEGCEPQCGNVCLRPTSLVTAGQHELEVV
jgi:predicted phage baseplate assembly protein